MVVGEEVLSIGVCAGNVVMDQDDEATAGFVPLNGCLVP